MIPLIITIIVFTLSKNIHLQSVGMVAVWGNYKYYIYITYFNTITKKK